MIFKRFFIILLSLIIQTIYLCVVALNPRRSTFYSKLPPFLYINPKPVAVVFCHLSSKRNYSPTVIGLDYNYVVSKGCYRQGVFQSVLRANKLGCNKVYLGMDASIEKQKFGARIIPKSAYIQADDNYNMEVISSVYHGKNSINEKARI